MEKLLLIDGHSILSRAYYGIPLLSTANGTHTNAVYGFLNILFKCIDEEKADYLAVAFDLERQKLKRTKLYPEYKGTRRPMPGELLEQVPIIQRVLSAMKIPILTLEGYEADDILGTIAKRAQADGYDVTIVSGDRDLLQLADERIKLCLPKTSKGRTEVFNYYPDDVLREYLVTPKEFIDLKALMGDTSDNIPGLPGVGEKTATDIIVSFHSIENAKEHADEVRPPRAQKALKEHYDLAVLSKQLATIDVSVPIEADPKACRTSSVYTAEAVDILRELELKTLVNRFLKYREEHPELADGSDIRPAAELIDMKTVKLVTDPFMAGIAFKDASDEELLGFYVTGRLPAEGSGDTEGRLAASLTLARDRSFVIVSGPDYPADRMKADLEKLLGVLTGSNARIVTMGLKDELKLLNIPANGSIEDHAIAQYVIDPNRSSYEYDDLARDLLGIQSEGRQELIGKLAPADAASKLSAAAKDGEERDRLFKYFALQAFVPFMAAGPVERKLKEQGSYELYKTIEMPLVYALNNMEKAGILVDRQALENYAALLKEQIDTLTKEIHEMAGEPFNINSTQQLGIILFEKLGISGGKKTKTGYSTAADVLEKIADQHEIVPKILRYRAITKLYSTYAYGLTEYIAPDGRIHGTFNQTIAATGRISSTEPNLQNIPVRTAEGKEIRRVFVPQEGYTFVDADYSQVELRILAALSGDEKLIAAYRDAVDVHTLTASEVFHVPVDEVTPEMRRNAKAVNFGIVYGISAFGLGEGLSISRKEANEYINKYFESYPKVREYLESSVAHAKENGYVTTYFGRIRPIPELKSSNFMQRSFGERIAMNSPIQGTAADIMKIAMNRVDEALKDMRSRIVLQVHDELLIETAEDELEKVMALVKDCMEHAADLPVSLSVEVKSGATWYDCH
ncbi:MAG: DNA polymerase I [Lachnospiraceae bacterium]|nr:DNA polymerase I [Lachnospiraceae bacterium]